MGAFNELLSHFGVHWQLLLIQGINFLCVVAILYYFAFRPILKTMEERRAKIESGLKYADDMKSQLTKVGELTKKEIVVAREEARKIIENAQTQAQNYSTQQKIESEEMTQRMLDAAKLSISEEKEKMLSDLKTEVKSLVIDVTSKVLKSNLTETDRERYINAVDKEL